MNLAGMFFNNNIIISNSYDKVLTFKALQILRNVEFFIYFSNLFLEILEYFWTVWADKFGFVFTLWIPLKCRLFWTSIRLTITIIVNILILLLCCCIKGYNYSTVHSMQYFKLVQCITTPKVPLPRQYLIHTYFFFALQAM